MSPYESPYRDSYFREGASGQSYDEGISNPFELAIFDLEKRYLGQIYSIWLAHKFNPAYLDYAAGTGRILGLFRDKTTMKFAVDTCPAQLASAQSKVPDATFIVDDIVTNPACVPIRFDLITCFRLFVNLEKANRLPILQALANRLKDDGILVVDNHMNRYSILGLIALFMRTCLGYKDKSLAHPGDKTIIGTMSEREMRKLLKDAGFVIKKPYRFMLLPGYSNYLILPFTLLVKLEYILAMIPGINFIGKNQIFVCQTKADKKSG